jgi:hypothetical protein
MAKQDSDTKNCYSQRYAAGRETFRRLFIHWMDTNRWSHPIMLSLSRVSIDGASWLHSSQISAFRAGKLHNPGPRSFIAIAELNKAIYNYKTKKRLIPGTTTDSDYLQGYAITQNGEAPSPDWWFGVFVGYIEPEGIPLDVVFTDKISAAEFSQKLGKLMRRLLAKRDYDIISDLDQAIRRHYPAGDAVRVAKFKDVLLGQDVWSAEEAEIEIAALAAMTSVLGGPSTATELIEHTV